MSRNKESPVLHHGETEGDFDTPPFIEKKHELVRGVREPRTSLSRAVESFTIRYVRRACGAGDRVTAAGPVKKSAKAKKWDPPGRPGRDERSPSMRKSGF